MSPETSQQTRYHTDMAKLPEHPGAGWTRFVCVSDTHSRKYPIPSGDVFIHAGDLTGYGAPSEVLEVVRWIQSQPHTVKV